MTEYQSEVYIKLFLFKHKTEVFKLASCFFKTQNASVETQLKAKQATIMHKLKDMFYAQRHKTLRTTTDTTSRIQNVTLQLLARAIESQWMSSCWYITHSVQEVRKNKV